MPNPQPGLSATLLPVGEGPGDEGAQLALPPEAITTAVDELTRDRSAMIPSLPFYLNRPVYCSVKHSI